MTPLAERAEAEVRARHAFFVEWFAGRASEADFAQSMRVFAPDMRLVGPEGEVDDRDAVIAMLRAARGARTEGFAIEITMHSAQDLGPNAVLVTYNEGQRLGGRRSLRRSTAVFSRDPAAPEGVVWRHLQETWINEKSAAGDAANPEGKA